ncbi:LysR family transcriptional regulator, glycine cleavage system transcriptional activator [Paracoccus halophilus]|uniref:LysR family transcriptional regulator n=1 Tax=Paracoccus halophilus TaxID=376733 RepID=A0A099EUM4_9RHOB|nr:LysR substrate-binding domain-containing protein [Paracoccus halophilus]KGJ02070.1 LysR family transcriptional regulator [Paracoccus halophilus]SFA62032.1 LysR family transcriptional regulator, glycine cleavage system transcriptional activator [Paracoccus halophilus]
MTLPPLNALRAFDAVVRSGSFRAAAELLFVTQPAISHQVKHLEDWLGVPLFDRGGRVPVLNQRGEALSRELTLAFDRIDSACDRARPQQRDNTLVIAAIPSVATCWLIPRLPRFREQHPEISLRIVYAHHGDDIDFGDVDLAFVFSKGEPSGQDFTAELFLSGDSVPVCSPLLLVGRRGGGIEPAELLELDLLHDTDDRGWKTWLEKVGHPVPDGKLPGAVFEDFNLLRIGALSGQGIALCSIAMIEPDLVDGRLIKLSEVTVLEEFAYYLVMSRIQARRQSVARKRETFLKWLFEERAFTARLA